MDLAVEKKFKILCEIVRSQHFAWREAVSTVMPEADVSELCNRMWRITGVETAKAYLKHIEPAQPLAAQVARCLAFSSVCMGEDAIVEAGEGDEAFVKHADCPWFHWHKRLGLVEEDQPGCDSWFFTVVAELNQALGTKIKIETKSSLPAGDAGCVRRIWVD